MPTLPGVSTIFEFKITYVAELPNKSFDLRYFRTYAISMEEALMSLWIARPDEFCIDEIEVVSTLRDAMVGPPMVD